LHQVSNGPFALGDCCKDVAAVVTSTNNTGSPWFNGLPAVPITAPVVYVDASECPNPTTINLTGKIALIDANRCGADGSDTSYNAKVAMCQAQGAIACIVEASPSWGTPEKMGGGAIPITIPAVHVNGFNGQKDFWHTNGPLTATIGADTHLKLGEADGAKGMSHVDFGIVVPSAGLYPMHLIYAQGGGGAGLEWTTLLPAVAFDSTNRMLINDTATAGSLLAYRSVTTGPKFTTFTVSGGILSITWTSVGTLQQATSVTGPWNDVAPQPAGNSYSVAATGPSKFFRLR